MLLAVAVVAAAVVLTARVTQASWPIKEKVREIDDTVLIKYCRRGITSGGRRVYRGFTALSEQSPSAQVADRLSRFYARANRC